MGGNAIIDPGEVCDDGNTVSGDGCRGDCGKIEVCGDGIVDAGEQCDDGNTNPADGCDACRTTTWSATALVDGHLLATQVALRQAVAVAVDRLGNFYIGDLDHHLVQRVDASGVITTVAGNGTDGNSGDGGEATSAEISEPYSLAIDGLGNLYIADQSSAVIRRVAPDGIITTVAGTGVYGSEGDGGPATGATLQFPTCIAVDGLGNLYICAGPAIRRVDPNGIITTFAGTAVSGFSGDNGPAVNATLDNPNGVVVDGQGVVYIADYFNARIRRVDPRGVITTIAGNGTYGSSGDGDPALDAVVTPNTITIDDLGNLYFADPGDNRIRRIDTGGIITTVAGNGAAGYSGDGGPAVNCTLAFPTDMAVDSMGRIYIADSNNDLIREVNAAGIITTVAGNTQSGNILDGAATTMHMGFPTGVAFDSAGNAYIADLDANIILRVDSAGVATTIAGTGVNGWSGDGGPAIAATFASPASVAFDAGGNLYIADSLNSVIRRVDANGIITTFAGTGAQGATGDGGAAIAATLGRPEDAVIDSVGNLYIADTNNNRVRRVTGGIITTVVGNGIAGFFGDGGAATNAEISSPTGLAFDTAGNLYIADGGNNRVRRVSPLGIITTVAGTGTRGYTGDGALAVDAELYQPIDVAVDPTGNVYFSDMGNDVVRRVDTAGIITTVVGNGTYDFLGDGGPATHAELELPWGIAFDALGRLYMTETDDGNVRRLTTGGILTTFLGAIDPQGVGPFAQGRLADPRALAAMPGAMLVAAGTSGTVEAAVTATSSTEVVIGRYPQLTATGSSARFRDQTFGTITGVAYDSTGYIYLTESSSNRIHVVTVVDPADVDTWTIAPLANAAGTPGFAEGAASTARFLDPTGLYFDPTARQLYVADTGNHVVRAIDLSTGVAGATVRTIAGAAQTRGYFGDGGPATAAELYLPQALVGCANGDLFIADTGNNRVRRIAAGTGEITTVLGEGVAASSGEGSPASDFPVDAPLGLACDTRGNVFVTSTTTVRLLPSDANGVVDGTKDVQTIYGAAPRSTFPSSVTSCLTGIAVVDSSTVEVADSCTGLLVVLHRQPT